MSGLKPLNIAQVVASTGNGGLERHAYDLSSGLVAQGHNVSFLTTKTLVSRVPKGIRSVGMSLDGSRKNPVVLWELINQLRSGRFDVIHAQGNKAAQMVALIRPLLQSTTVTIGTLHNQKKNRGAFRKLDWAIGVSNALSKDIGGNKVTTIYHGLPDFSEIKPAFVPDNRERPVFLAVGRLVEAKGFDLLIEAWRSIDAELLILGDGPLEGELKNLVKELHLIERVKMLGRIEEVPAYLKAADGVIVPSRREGFSYVVAEALLCKCPVLATNVPVANEVMDPELILAGDVREMSTQLERWVADIDGLRTKCQKAFELAALEFTLKNMVSKTENLYRTLVEIKQSRSHQR